jgi:rsbT co-antagonist protein RsbR
MLDKNAPGENPLRDENEALHQRIAKLEEELAHERNLNATILETTDFLCTMLDPEGRIILFNRACEQTTGYTAEEVIGTYVWDTLIPSEQKETVKGIFQELSIDQIPNRYENHWLTSDGQRRLLAWSNTALKDQRDNLVAIISTAQDITGRRQREEDVQRLTTQLKMRAEESIEKMLQSQMFLQGFIEHSPAAVFIKDTDGRVIHANKQLEWLLGRDPGTIIGTTAYDLVPKEVADDVWGSELETLRTGKPFEREETIPTGNTFAILLSTKFPIYDTHGNPVAVGGILTDITERKHMQQALQQSEERMRLVLDATNDGMWDWNLPANDVYYSPRWQTMLGYAPDELEGTPQIWETLLHPDDRARALQVVGAHMHIDSPSFALEFRMRTKDGHWKWIHARGKVVEWDEQGNALRMIGTHTDIDERKRLEDERDIFKKVIESAPDGFTLSDNHGIIYANPAFRAMTGLGDQIIGVSHGATVHPDDHAWIRETVFPAIEQEGLWRGTMRMRRYQGTPDSDSETWSAHVSSIRIDGSHIKRAGIWRDITEQEQQIQRHEALQQQLIDAQQAAIRELSSPLLPLTDTIIALPLIGSIDTQRAQQIMETLLEGVAHYRADIAIIDITGISVVDTQVANALIQTAQAVQLLGAQVILTGIGPAMAQTLVGLGVELSSLVTLGSLQTGIAYALKQKG